MSAAAAASPLSGSLGRPTAEASSASPAISAARTAEGGAPTSNVNSSTAASAGSHERRRPTTARLSACSSPATTEMLKPETATTWLVPDAAYQRGVRLGQPALHVAAEPAPDRPEWPDPAGLCPLQHLKAGERHHVVYAGPPQQCGLGETGLILGLRQEAV